MYDFIDDNPGVIAYSADYTNSPIVVASIDNFVSITEYLKSFTRS